MRKLIYSTLCIALLLSNGLLAQETTTIKSEQAFELMDNYKKKYPNNIFGHSVGSDILSEIASLNDIDKLKLYFGTDNEGSEKIIYQAFNDENKAISPFGDDGKPCPPYCPKEDPEENIVSIGHYISDETAINWISNYTGDVKSYTVSVNAIISLLDQPETSGIYFSRALDQENNFTMVLTALTAEGEYLDNGLFYSGGEICMEECLALPNVPQSQLTSTIRQNQAIELMNNYKKANSEKTAGYAVGSNILSEIARLKEITLLKLYFGVDDEGSEKIIYQAFNDENRVISPYGDDGKPCPPNCPNEEEDPKQDIAFIGHYISDETAKNWISNYTGDVKSYTVSIKAIIRLLDQQEASGIYFSRAFDQENNFTMVLTALNADGEYLESGHFYSGGVICTEDCLTLPVAITKK